MIINTINFKADKVPAESKGKVKYLYDETPLFVEDFAIKKYQEMGYEAYFTENDFWWTIMSLLFWNVIFADIEDQFDQPGQDMPHDFFKASFFQNREEIINNRLLELRNSDLAHKITITHENNFGRNCRSIADWDRYSLETILKIITSLKKEIVISICERLIKNFKVYRMGLPDLTVIKNNETFFVEVKSENDKLSSSQIYWHKYLINVCKQKVELFLINHTDKGIKSIMKSYDDPKKEINISFGKSSSQKREEAISHIQNQPSFIKEGEGNDAIFSAIFNTNNLNDIFKILDLTRGWKSLEIKIDHEIIKATDLKFSLNCYKEKVETGAGDEWCKEWYDDKVNVFGCKQIFFPELNSNKWNDYGYVDTEKGVWIFDKDKIRSELRSRIDKHKHCPYFDSKKAYASIENLPESINPMTNDNWAFLSDQYHWIYYNNKWINWDSSYTFPGYSMMTGVVKLSSEDKNDIIHLSKSETTRYTEVSKDRNTITINVPSKQENSGCFIATYAYGDYNAPEVVRFRQIRDNYIIYKWWGGTFISIYYFLSPKLVKIFNYFPSIKAQVRKILSKLLTKIDAK